MVMARHCPEAADLDFMTALPLSFDGVPVEVSRSGYTGEDGYEISVAAEDAPALWAALLAEPEVKAIGLGARDSLQAGSRPLPLRSRHRPFHLAHRGSALNWSIQKRRRP